MKKNGERNSGDVKIVVAVVFSAILAVCLLLFFMAGRQPVISGVKIVRNGDILTVSFKSTDSGGDTEDIISWHFNGVEQPGHKNALSIPVPDVFDATVEVECSVRRIDGHSVSKIVKSRKLKLFRKSQPVQSAGSSEVGIAAAAPAALPAAQDDVMLPPGAVTVSAEAGEFLNAISQASKSNDGTAEIKAQSDTANALNTAHGYERPSRSESITVTKSGERPDAVPGETVRRGEPRVVSATTSEEVTRERIVVEDAAVGSGQQVANAALSQTNQAVSPQTGNSGGDGSAFGERKIWKDNSTRTNAPSGLKINMDIDNHQERINERITNNYIASSSDTVEVTRTTTVINAGSTIETHPVVRSTTVPEQYQENGRFRYNDLAGAITARDIETARRLIAAGYNLYAAGPDGRMPVHLAVEHELPQIVIAMTDQNCNIRVTDSLGRTPLHIAAGRNSLDIATILINFDERFAHRVTGEISYSGTRLSNVKDNRGQTPLHAAAINNAMEVAALMLDHNADPNIQDNSGSSPLHLAVMNRSERILPILVNRGGNVNLRDNFGNTPLTMGTTNIQHMLRALTATHTGVRSPVVTGTQPVEMYWPNGGR